MTQLIPAILGETPAELEEQLSRVGSLASLISYDVTDGILAGPQTPKIALYPMPLKGASIFWHLMVSEPAEVIDSCFDFPTSIVALHVEATGLETGLSALRRRDIQIGLAINPDTPVSALTPYITTLDFVQVMTVQPGRQGQGFLPEQLLKIQEIRLQRSDIQIAIDGGLNHVTIPLVQSYHPDYLIVGSALTRAQDAAETYSRLEHLVA